MEANIDERPTDESLAQFLELLTAGMDTLQTGTTEVGKASAEKSNNAAVKSMTPSTTSPCKFWGTDHGCHKGKKCSYVHGWQAWEDRNARQIVQFLLLSMQLRQQGGMGREEGGTWRE